MNTVEPKQRGCTRVTQGNSTCHWRLDGAATDARAPVLWCLHGQGMNEDSFANLLQGLFDLPWHIVTLRAPLPAPAGTGWSWYDYDGNQERFRAELQRNESLWSALVPQIESELRLQPRLRVLLGFSQGGYCGATVALRQPDRFAGMVVSGARVKIEILGDAITAAGALGFRVLLCHGRRDRSVSPEAAESSLAGLRVGGVEAQLQHFDTGHALGRTQVQAIRTWLQSFPD